MAKLFLLCYCFKINIEYCTDKSDETLLISTHTVSVALSILPE